MLTESGDVKEGWESIGAHSGIFPTFSREDDAGGEWKVGDIRFQALLSGKGQNKFPSLGSP